MDFELWLAQPGSTFIGKDSDGEMLTANEDGVEPAMDLRGFVTEIHLGPPEPLE